MHDEAAALDLLEAFLRTGYSGDERHSRRIGMLTGYESGAGLPPLPTA
jgi:ribose 5-phosphate isomerase B